LQWNAFSRYSVTLFIHAFITLLVAWLLQQEFVCIDDYEYDEVKCRPKCNFGKFGLIGMTSCHSWLSCSEIDQIQIYKDLSQGAVKQVYYCHFPQYF